MLTLSVFCILFTLFMYLLRVNTLPVDTAKKRIKFRIFIMQVIMGVSFFGMCIPFVGGG